MARSDTLGTEHEVRLPQGTVRYRITGPEDGPVLVFVHGFMVNGDLWRNVVPALAERYRCVVPDLPMGSHEIPLGPDTDLSLYGLADIVAGLLDALDLRDVTLIGNDTGGAVVQCTVTEHPGRIGRMVLTPCDAFDNFPPSALAYLVPFARLVGVPGWVLRALRFRPLQRLPIMYGWFAKRPIEDAAMRSYLEPGARDPHVRRNLRSLILSLDSAITERVSRRLTEFTGPALVVWSERDRLFPPAHGRRLAELLPDGRRVTLRDTYGCVPEDQPARLTALIADFLAETATTTETAATTADARHRGAPEED